jgi:hypothetical protein
MIVQSVILRVMAARKLTPQRGQTSDSAPTISLQLGHFRRTTAYLSIAGTNAVGCESLCIFHVFLKTP